MEETLHKPVLLNEIINVLSPKPGENFIDGTFGGGGHSLAIWEKIQPAGQLLAVDWNKAAINRCEELFNGKISCVEGNFTDLSKLMASINFPRADGLALDLGVSSDELEKSGRGFSFNKNEPLLMTYGDNLTPVKDIIVAVSEVELKEIIKIYGEERFAGRIARVIKERGRVSPLKTTKDLTQAILSAVPKNYERHRIHPATRTFMALRIYANHELENLRFALDNLPDILKTNGRAAIISFHSLEDRLVKNKFRELARAGRAELLTKKPITPTREEANNNPRARSAKLRAIRIINPKT